MARSPHGKGMLRAAPTGMQQFWRETSGYGIDQLTQSEAGHRGHAASVDAIRDRGAKARREGISYLGGSRTETPRSKKRGR